MPRFICNISIKIKTIIVSILFLLICSVSVSSAFVPVFIAAWYAGSALAPYIVGSVALHVAGAGAYLAYGMVGTSSIVDSVNKKIIREAQVTWVDIEAGVPKIKAAIIPAKVKISDVLIKAELEPAKYPKLTESITNNGNASDGLPVGPLSIILRLGNLYGDGSYIVQSDVRIRRNLQQPGDTHIDSWDPVDHNYRFARKYLPVVTNTVQKEESIRQALIDEQLSNNIRTDFRGEIDDIIKNNPNIIETAEPLPIPATRVAIDSALSSIVAVAKEALRVAQEARVQTAANAANVALTGSVNARLLATNARNLSNANSTDNALADNASRLEGLADTSEAYSIRAGADSAAVVANVAAIAAAAAAVDADNSAAAALAAETAAKDEINAAAVALPGSNSYDGTVEAPESKSILSLLTGFLAGSPLVAMVNSFQVSVADANCSVFVGEVYGQQMTIDVCRWDPYLRAAGGMFLIIMQGYAVLVVVRGW